ncbi:zinc finger protein 473 homolog [Epinephelus moara]|uniref:zinc finger protein 473 homolog n=1 Tax=Epinephelus moara TaxID=300413 RepID=UPI00214E411F|nr:zinc finger protein 473 homolog [Epinephelus moara]
MCSVVGCDSWRRSAQRFKLPEDPERRLEWVQFLATVNKQRFKESSWTDITICSEHFKADCFDKPTPSRSGVTGTAQLMLNPSAVPSVCVKSESEEPETNLRSPKVEPEETTEVTCERDQLKPCGGPTSSSEESKLLMADRGSPVPTDVSCSSDASDAVISVHGQMQPQNKNFDLIREKAALVQTKGKYVVNEKRLLQLFSHKCPLCGSEVKTEKVTHGVVIILNQQCLQCEYRNQWKSQVSAKVPTAEDQHLTGGTEVTPETQQAAPTDDTHIPGVPQVDAVIDEENDTMDESSDQDNVDSDEDWKPAKHFLVRGVLKKTPDDKIKDQDDDPPPPAPKNSELCTECGTFFNKQKPHTCEHKIKPYSCSICGKRCVSETALNTHSRIHNENYEHRCKFCHATFKTKAGKVTHEQVHVTQGKPYKCPDCSETFATNKERRIHLEDHRGPPQLKCDICGTEFLWPLSLQRHLAVHTGLKPFKCSVCQRGFNQASHLKSHMRLHTGERPFKCQHCGERFNHNVSLKSHVQRYHTSDSGHEQKKINTEEEEDPDSEDEVQKRTYRPKNKRKTTGRPIGRPKSHEPSNLQEGQCSNTNTGNLQGQMLKRAQCSDEESKDSGTAFDSAEAEEKSCKEATKKNSDSDSDFDPEKRKKKRNSSQSGGKSSGKRRGKPCKSVEEES